MRATGTTPPAPGGEGYRGALAPGSYSRTISAIQAGAYGEV